MSLNFELKNNLVTKFLIFAGLATTAKLALQGLKCLRKQLSRPQSLESRYGEKAWALIADLGSNIDAVEYLGNQGFNLILFGSAAQHEQHKAKVTAIKQAKHIEVENVEVDWSVSEADAGFYKQIGAKFARYDVGIIVLPKVADLEADKFGEESKYPVCQHNFYIVATFIGQLKRRANRAAIIFTSDHRSQKVEFGRAVQNGACTAVDFFALGLSSEAADYCDIIVNKSNSLDKAFKDVQKGKLISCSRA